MTIDTMETGIVKVIVKRLTIEVGIQVSKTATVVDYEAWKKGYMPPGEHILIHELSYEGARIVSSTAGSGFSWWLVVKGDFKPKRFRAVQRMLHEQMMLLEENEDAAINPALDVALRKEYGR